MDLQWTQKKFACKNRKLVKSLNFTLTIDNKIQFEKNQFEKIVEWQLLSKVLFSFLYYYPPPDRVHSQCVILKLLTDLGGNIGCFDEN